MLLMDYVPAFMVLRMHANTTRMEVCMHAMPYTTQGRLGCVSGTVQ
jgi:hypothetical protein